MAFQDTIKSIKKSSKAPIGKIAILMGVSCSQVYRYLEGESQPKWSSVISMLDGLGYELKITKKVDKEKAPNDQ